MSEARQHHIVPQCYLKGFTHNGSKNSRLFVVDLTSATFFTTSPAKVGKQRDFNRIEGRPAGGLDNRLSKFETKLADSLKKIAAERSIRDQEAWRDVVNLMALLGVRNPRTREMFGSFREDIAKTVAGIALATQERWEAQVAAMKRDGVWKDTSITYEQLKKFLDEGNYKVETPTGHHVRLEFSVLDKVIRRLYQRTWSLLIAPAGSGGFVSFDHPVCLMSTDDRERRAIGYGSKDTAVMFPLTRELLLRGTFGGKDGVRTVAPTYVAYANTAILAFAERQVYASDDRCRFIWGEDERVIFASELPGQLRKDE